MGVCPGKANHLHVRTEGGGLVEPGSLGKNHNKRQYVYPLARAGLTIGAYTMIREGAEVRREFPAHSLVTGNPTRIVEVVPGTQER